MKRDEDVVDRNLRKLLLHSYRPAAPDPTFRAELREQVLLAVGRSRPSDASRHVPGRSATVRIVMATAALFALFLAAGWMFTQWNRPSSLEEILARGEVALRSSQAEAWRAADDDHVVLAGSSSLEVRTPSSGTFRIEVMPLGDLLLDHASHVQTASHADADTIPVKVWLEAGGIEARRESSQGQWLIETVDGTIHLGSGRLRVEHDAVGAVHAILLAGEAWIARDGTRVDLVAGIDAVLRLIDIPASPTGDVPEPTRTAQEETEAEPPRPDTPTETVRIEGTVRDAQSGESIGAFRLALLQLEIGDRGEPAYGADPVTASYEDSDATFRLSDVEPGRYRLFVSAKGYASWRSDAFLIRDGDPVLELNALLPRGATVRGRVFDAKTGQPVVGAFVFSESETAALLLPIQSEWLTGMTASSPPKGTITDAVGMFELTGLGSGDHLLRAGLDGYVPTRRKVENLRAGETRIALECPLSTGGGIEGRVTRDDGSVWTGAVLLAMPQIEINDSGSRICGMAMADEQGRYRIGDLAAGIYVVILLGDSTDRHGASAAKRVIPTAVGVSGFTTLDFLGRVGGARLFGRILAADGTPLRRTTLSLARLEANGTTDTEGWSGYVSDDEGGYEFVDLRPGQYQVYLTDTSGLRVILLGRFEVTETAETRRDFRQPDGSISGRVIDGDRAAANALLLVRRVDSPSAGENFFARRPCDRDGRFEIAGVPPGIYDILVRDASDRAGSVLRLRLESSQHLRDVDVLVHSTGTLEILVRDQDGQPLADVPIRLFDPQGLESLWGWGEATGASGGMTVTGLPPGRWRVLAEPDGFESVETSVDLRVHQIETVELKARKQ